MQTFRRWRLSQMRLRIKAMEGDDSKADTVNKVKEWARKTSIAIMKEDNKIMNKAGD